MRQDQQAGELVSRPPVEDDAVERMRAVDEDNTGWLKRSSTGKAGQRAARYGTQFWRGPDGTGPLEPRPIEDPDRLDERRRSVGLEPFAEYDRRMREQDTDRRWERSGGIQLCKNRRSGTPQVRVRSPTWQARSDLLEKQLLRSGSLNEANEP
jgi:hypothetical protein